MITAPRPSEGGPWSAVRMSDYSLAQTPHSLSRSGAWLPGRVSPIDLAMCRLGRIGKLGTIPSRYYWAHSARTV